MLILTGELDEARATLDVGEALLPEYLEFNVLQLLIHALRGETAAANARLDKLKTVYQAEVVDLLGVGVEVLPLIVPEYKAGLNGEPRESITGMWRSLKITNLLTRFPAARLVPRIDAEPSTAIASAPVPHIRLPPVARPYLDALLLVSTTALKDPNLLSIIQNDDQHARLKRVVMNHPERFLRYLYGYALLVRSQEYLGRTKSDDDRYMELLADAAAAFRLSWQAKGLFDLDLLPLDGLLTMEGVMGSPKRPKPDLEARKRAAAYVREYMNRAQVPANRRLLYTIVAKNAEDFQTARRILDDWEASAPKDTEAMKHRAEIEFKAENYLAAARAARRLLDVDKTNKAIQDLEANALRNLKEITQPPK